MKNPHSQIPWVQNPHVRMNKQKKNPPKISAEWPYQNPYKARNHSMDSMTYFFQGTCRKVPLNRPSQSCSMMLFALIKHRVSHLP